MSPNGKRVIIEARGDIFTVPVEFGDSRNITSSSGVADRRPVWSPMGDKIAWFSDKNKRGYQLIISNQDGTKIIDKINIGESKLAWNPSWSHDGNYIAFVDDDCVRLRVVDLRTKDINTIDIGGNNLERNSIKMSWKILNGLLIQKQEKNMLRQIYLWSSSSKKSISITDPFADSFFSSWDLNKKQLYFLASTNIALGSGWANTSSMMSDETYAAYVINLNLEDDSPFKPKSDEEDVSNEISDKNKKIKSEDTKNEKESDIKIDFNNIGRRILALPIPVRNYSFINAGIANTAFIGERIPNKRGLTLHKFDLTKKESKRVCVRNTKYQYHWKTFVIAFWWRLKLAKTSASNAKGAKSIKPNLQMKLNRSQEWVQMFEEAWRYERDYFYDPNLHGRNWNTVYKRYAPLIQHVKHRSDLNYIFDQMNGELSVGHSFVGGGDYPVTEKNMVGLLGADFTLENGRYKISRILTSENWNPGLYGPLDAPGLKISRGNYIVGIKLTKNSHQQIIFSNFWMVQLILKQLYT